MASNTYSFLDVQAAIDGPNGSFSIGNGAGSSDEGITVAQAEDRGSLVVGADGYGMHSLHAAKNGSVTVRLLKTSPTNAMLMDMFNIDTSSSANYGQNTISIRNPVSGDSVTCVGCGFRKVPDVVYGKDGGMMEWTWNAAQIDYVLGTGTPAVL
ncbi:phage protein [Bosea sp. AS-1]|uniref:phage protein n=1 Tax=Bosea sp. AS-1 TaxID=2015316 RepID=UPI000B798948|nr:phage protein [Bosea sp. AS-1]